MLGKRRPPIGHDRVADIFVDDAAMAADRSRHRRQVVIHHLDKPLRRHAFAEAGKAFHVAEQHRHHAPLAVGGGRRLPGDQAFDDAGIDIAAEGFAQALLVAQLFDMLLKAAVSWPISSRVVTSIDPSSRPASTARVPSRSRRTGRVMPVLMKSENISPRTPASRVRITEMTIAVFWSRIVAKASPRTCDSMSVRISSILWLSSSRSVSVRARLARASVIFPASSIDNSRLYSL